MPEHAQRVAFADAETRPDEMHSTIDQWLDELADETNEARASKQFQQWLDAQAQFHDYSARNTLLIHHQCPEATRVAGYRTWQEAFDRQVQEGESAIWIWAPIITDQCPTCGNGRNYHTEECTEDSDPKTWDEGVVAFKPVPVFDVSQTDGEPLPGLDTAAYANRGEATELFSALCEVSEGLGVSLSMVPATEWSHGAAKGVCRSTNGGPHIELQQSENVADMASVLVHEYAHALLHVNEGEDEAVAEIEAEAVAYVVGRYCGLDVSNAAFYLAGWADEERDVLQERLNRISRTARQIIEATGV